MAAWCLRAPADDLDDLIAHTNKIDAHAFECPGSDPFAFVEEAEQDVLRADVAVVEEARFFLSKDHDSACPVGKALKHCRSTPDYLWQGTRIISGGMSYTL